MLRVLAILLFCILKHCDARMICNLPKTGAGTCASLTQRKCLSELNTRESKKLHFTYRESDDPCEGYTESDLEKCCPSESDQLRVAETPAPSQETTVQPTFSVRTHDLTDQEEKIPKVCGTEAYRAHKKIFGGVDAEIDRYPWMTLLEYEENEFKCGGSLISTKFVLTAAHCFRSSLPTHVILSKHNIYSGLVEEVKWNGRIINVTANKVPVEWARKHPGYRPQTSMYKNDIAMIKMSYPVEFTDFIRPICLPNMDYNIVFTNKTLFVAAGWGSDEEHQHTDVKKAVVLPYVAAGDCQSPLPDNEYICAGGEDGKDTCRGDSGGPLMYKDFNWKSKYVIVGVVSSGYQFCGTEGKPGFYTSVYKHLGWIHDMMKE